MSDHQKRLSVPKSWPVERKTGTFTVKAGAGPHGEAGVPLLVLLRDVLGYVDSRKEARYALDQDAVLVNGEPVADETRPIGMFDILAFGQREEYFRVFPGEGGRLALTPIDADAAGSKLSKIEDKRQAPGGATQLNLHDGTNLRVEEGDYAAGDSIVVDNESADVVAHFPYEEGALVTAVSGRHAGEIGTVDTIEVTPGSAPNNVRVETDDGSFETVEEYVVVIDENFTGEAGPAAEPEDVTEPAAEEAGGADADAAEPDAADDTASGDEDDVAPDDEEDTPAADEEDDASTADDEEDEAPDDEEAAKADDDAETADDEDDTTANDDAAATADDEADETADDAGSDDGGDAA